MQHSVTNASSKISWFMQTSSCPGSQQPTAQCILGTLGWQNGTLTWRVGTLTWQIRTLANWDPNLANWDPNLVSWDHYLANSLLPVFDPLCPAFSDLIFAGGVQQGQLVVPVLVVVNHATDIIIDHKLDLKRVLQHTAVTG